MRYFYILFLPLIIFSSCLLKTNKDDTLSFNDPKTYLRQGNLQNFKSAEGWYVTNGQSKIDTTTQYKDEFSLLSTPNKEDTTKFSQVFYMINAEAIEGSFIRFSGKYKVSSIDSVNVQFGIQQLTNGPFPTDTTKMELQIGESDWMDFSIEASMHELSKNIIFYIYTKGDVQLWTSNLKATIDDKPIKDFINIEYEAKKDKEFKEASNITLPSLDTQTTENLEALGKVWGFLKYYHPEVVKGKYNWDYELFRVLPQIANAENKDERNKLLNKWMDKYGKIEETEKYVIEDSTKYSRIINLDWLKDENLFDEKLRRKLEGIKNAKRSKKLNYYMLNWGGGFDAFANKESPHSNIKWDDQGYRILSLFRLWNAVEYCFPYVEMTDTPWEGLLQKFIPEFVNPENKLEYELSMMKLLANIDDSHGGIDIPKNNLHESLLDLSWKNRMLIELTKSKEGDIVVSATQRKELQRGDIILNVDEKNINDIIEEYRLYTPSSNEATLARDALPRALTHNGFPKNIKIQRNGKLKNIKIDPKGDTQDKISIRTPESYKLNDKGIGYIEVSSVNLDSVNAILENNKKGVILDMRIYPGAVWHKLFTLLTPKAEPFVWFSENEKQQVGNYKFMSATEIGSENPNYYKGKVAIIVNEGTQSHGEFSSMAYRKAPNSAIIGSQTAGADGNVAIFTLPGGSKVIYTHLGTYYPNWEICQREGIKIDIPVRPTTQDIKDGKDILIEKAIEYIMK